MRRRTLLVTIGVVTVFGLLGLFGYAWIDSRPAYVIVPGADMAQEAGTLCRSLDDVLPAVAQASWSLRGGFQPKSVIAVVGVTRPEEQDALLAEIRSRHTEMACRYPVKVLFREPRVVTSQREVNGARITHSRDGATLRTELIE
jgi:hypothetical protein